MVFPNARTLEVLIHHYWSPDPYPTDSTTVNNAVDWLGGKDMLRLKHHGTKHFEITEKGKAHVEALLNVPLPTQKWVGYTAPK